MDNGGGGKKFATARDNVGSGMSPVVTPLTSRNENVWAMNASLPFVKYNSIQEYNKMPDDDRAKSRFKKLKSPKR
jgi:hypothetical protein